MSLDPFANHHNLWKIPFLKDVASGLHAVVCVPNHGGLEKI
jgi:hypothetical protein